MRVCTHDGCSASIRSDNTSGYCRVHYSLSPKAKLNRKQYFQNNWEIKRAKDRLWYENNKVRALESQRKYNENNRDSIYASKAKKRYGLSQDALSGLITTQGNLCAICGGSPSGYKQRLCVDHCHKTGKVRGLLCGKCNAGIGLLSDKAGLATAAAAYLERYKDFNEAAENSDRRERDKDVL